MGAAVGDPADRVAVREHLVDDSKITGAVILESVQQQSCAPVLQKQFQREIEGITADRSSPVSDTGREVRLVVQWLTEFEGALKDRRHPASVLVIRALFDQPATKVAIIQNTGGSLLMIEPVEGLPQRVGEEGMPGGL